MNKDFVNQQEINSDIFDALMSESVSCFIENDLQFFNDLFSQHGVKLLMDDILNREWQPVGIDGILKNYKRGDKIGNYRLSVYSQELADII